MTRMGKVGQRKYYFLSVPIREIRGESLVELSYAQAWV